MDCCNFYEDSVFVETCTNPFVNNTDNICVCPEGRAGENCEGCKSMTATIILQNELSFLLQWWTVVVFWIQLMGQLS